MRVPLNNSLSMLSFVIADGDFLLLTIDNPKSEFKEDYEKAYFDPEGIG